MNRKIPAKTHGTCAPATQVLKIVSILTISLSEEMGGAFEASP